MYNSSLEKDSNLNIIDRRHSDADVLKFESSSSKKKIVMYAVINIHTYTCSAREFKRVVVYH